MGLSKKLTVWQQAGLISAEQAQAIAHYDGAQTGGRFLKGLVGAALFAILCGVLAIVAANWMDIPAGVKIATHALINALVAYGLWRTSVPLRREGLCLLLFGLTLTFIVLVGQVFQLGGSWSGALMLWMVITAPLMVFYGETRIAAVPWMIAFLGSVCVVLVEHLESLPDFWSAIITGGLALFLPLALIADGNIDKIRQWKPVWADLFIRTGFALLLLMATLASLLWYLERSYLWMADSIGISEGQSYAALLGLFAASVIAQGCYAWQKKFYDYSSDEKAAALIAFFSTLFMALPIIVTENTFAVGSAFHLIAFWVLIGWIAQGQGWHRLVSLAIVLITIRIFIIYCELFGSLMTTGFGLIVGGLVMLGLLWGARKLNKTLKVMA